MGFEAYTGKNRESGRSCQLRIYPTGQQGYLTAGAVEEYFTRHGSIVDEVAFHVDRDFSQLGIECSPDDGDTFSMTDKGDQGGGSIHVAGVLRKAFDVDHTDLSESYHMSLERDSETGFIIVDLTDVVEDATDSRHCPKCGKRCATASAVNMHATRAHDDPSAKLSEMDPDEIGEEIPDGDDSWRDLQERSAQEGDDD